MAKKKNKALKKIKGFFVALILIVAIVFIGIFGFKGYSEVNKIAKIIEEFEYQSFVDYKDKIDLPTKINDQIQIEWTSSNESVISNEGEIFELGLEEDSVVVTLTGNVIVNYNEFLSETVKSLLGIEYKQFIETITVEAKELTDLDKVNLVKERLELIDETYSSIYLPTCVCYESIVIKWDSLNDSILSDDGIVTTPSSDTVVKLKALITSNDASVEKEFSIKVLKDEPVLNIIDDNFDNQAATSQYKTIVSTSGVIYNNARIMVEDGAVVEDETDINATIASFLRLRNKDENNGSFEVNNIINPKTFSFKYKFSGSQKTESSILRITISSNGVESIVDVNVTHLDQYQEYSINLDQYDVVSINVKHIDEWSGDTYIDIDDVKMDTFVSIEDVEKWVINNVPSAVSKSLVLPFTTQYGGIVKWESNSPALTNQGIVNRTEKSQTVTLTAKINYLGKESTITIEIIVKGLGAVQELEIFFIDIGKYGAGDCGECTYIKYGDIDIIVDAGDHFDSTAQAITEAINQRLEDGVIEYLIATHPDADHIGGMPVIFENYEVETLIKFEGDYTSNKYKNMEQAWINEGCEVYQIQSDIIDKNKEDKFIELSNDVFISFVDTTYYTCDESNGKSIVFTLDAYGTRVLMTGDADNASGHTDLESKYQDKIGQIDILKVVHHGTTNGTTMEFLNAIKPEVAIICNGNYLGNKHGHPTPTCINNLYNYNANIKVYAITGGGTIDGVANLSNKTYKCSSEDRFNQRNGTITIIIDNNGYDISSEYYGNNMMEIKDTYYYQGIISNGLG